MEDQPISESKYYILLSITKPLHGYAIMQNISELTGGRIEMGAGTLYGALKNMVKNGYAVPVSGSLLDRKKEYKITDKGTELLKKEIKRYQELLDNGKQVLEEKNG